jgi:hypothetical protein
MTPEDAGRGFEEAGSGGKVRLVGVRKDALEDSLSDVALICDG